LTGKINFVIIDNMIETLRVHLYVSGIVQGVFFRAYTQDIAQSLGLTGWVKNLRDGRVEITAEGSRNKIEKLIQWCSKGPPGAEVEDVDINWETVTNEFREFRILY